MYPSPKTPLPNYQRPILYYSNGTSSDGMAEYTAPTFGGQLLGNIISTTYAGSQSVRRVVLAEDGLSVLFEEDLGIFSQPLDVAVGTDGSIYVAEYGANDIQIMEPDAKDRRHLEDTDAASDRDPGGWHRGMQWQGVCWWDGLIAPA